VPVGSPDHKACIEPDEPYRGASGADWKPIPQHPPPPLTHANAAKALIWNLRRPHDLTTARRPPSRRIPVLCLGGGFKRLAFIAPCWCGRDIPTWNYRTSTGRPTVSYSAFGYLPNIIPPPSLPTSKVDGAELDLTLHLFGGADASWRRLL